MEGGGGIIYLSLHCHHQNDSCTIKMGSDESQSDVSLTVRGKVTRQYPQTTTSQWRQRRASRKRIRTEGLGPTSLSLRLYRKAKPAHIQPGNKNFYLLYPHTMVADSSSIVHRFFPLMCILPPKLSGPDSVSVKFSVLLMAWRSGRGW